MKFAIEFAVGIKENKDKLPTKNWLPKLYKNIQIKSYF